ncbi:MAG: hypothetical protein ACK48F_14005 [Chryseotalea sp.]
MKTSRIEYIESQLNWQTGLIYPGVTTIILLTIYPYASELAYKIWLYFRHRKFELKEKMEDKKRLTIEQSIAIRLELKSMEEKYEKLNSDKDNQIEILKMENSKLLEDIAELTKEKSSVKIKEPAYNTLNKTYDFISKNEELKKLLEEIHLNSPVNPRADNWYPKLRGIKELDLQGTLEQREERGIKYYYVSELGKKVLLKLREKK